MSYLNLKVAAVVADYPAYTVVRRETTQGAFVDQKWNSNVEFTEIVADDQLGLARSRYYQEFSPGSVVSYAMKNGEDPIAAIEDAVARGHNLHWINACASSITSHARPKETLVEVKIGMVVRFEGRLFTIEKAMNNNLDLVPYKAPEEDE